MQSIIGLIAIIVALIAVVELTPVCLEDSRVDARRRCKG